MHTIPQPNDDPVHPDHWQTQQPAPSGSTEQDIADIAMCLCDLAEQQAKIVDLLERIAVALEKQL